MSDSSVCCSSSPPLIPPPWAVRGHVQNLGGHFFRPGAAGYDFLVVAGRFFGVFSAASIFDRFSTPFFIDFGSVSGAILARKIDQKSMKIGFEMRPLFRSIFDRFQELFSSTSESCDSTPMWVFPRENVHPSINTTSKRMSVWASILEPSWLHFGFKNRPRSVKKRLRKGAKFSIDFGADFSSIFGPFRGPRWGHVGPIFG